MREKGPVSIPTSEVTTTAAAASPGPGTQQRGCVASEDLNAAPSRLSWSKSGPSTAGRLASTPQSLHL